MTYWTVEECCDILDKQRVPVTESERVKGQYPYYGANGVQDYVADFIFDDELVLVAEDGGNFGSRTKPIAYRVSGKCWVNNHAHVLKAHPVVDDDFLCYSLMYYPVDQLVNGSTRKKLNQAELRKMRVPQIPLVEQRDIVQKLHTLEESVFNRQRVLALLDKLVKARFVEMFGEQIIGEKGWQHTSLDALCNDIVDCPHSTPHYVNNDTGFGCIRTTIVKKNRLLWENLEYISEDEYNDRTKRRKPQQGDIVYTREGAILGIAAVIDRATNVALGQRTMLLSQNKKICNSVFLCTVMNSDSFYKQVTQGMLGSASPHINVKDIKKFKIPVPPLAMQNKFAAFVHQVDASKAAVQAQLAGLTTLRAKLMQDFFG